MCSAAKSIKATYYRDLKDYQGYGVFNSWDSKVSGEVGPLLQPDKVVDLWREAYYSVPDYLDRLQKPLAPGFKHLCRIFVIGGLLTPSFTVGRWQFAHLLSIHTPSFISGIFKIEWWFCQIPTWLNEIPPLWLTEPLQLLEKARKAGMFDAVLIPSKQLSARSFELICRVSSAKDYSSRCLERLTSISF